MHVCTCACVRVCVRPSGSASLWTKWISPERHGSSREAIITRLLSDSLCEPLKIEVCVTAADSSTSATS